MEPELLNILQDCESLAGRLLELLEQDREEMPYCVSGPILAEYQRVTDGAQSKVRAIRTDLRELSLMG